MAWSSKHSYAPVSYLRLSAPHCCSSLAVSTQNGSFNARLNTFNHAAVTQQFSEETYFLEHAFIAC